MADRTADRLDSTASTAAGAIALGDGRVRLVWVGAAVEREAAELRRQTSAQSEAIRQAAEREAAALRALVLEMSAGARTIQPATRPAARPGKTRPGTGTGTKGRQLRAMRKMQLALVVLALVGVIGGATEIELHGLSFFLFRNAGAGAGNSSNLEENQGPGQPDAPGVRHAPSVKQAPHAPKPHAPKPPAQQQVR